jgi:hypothetical protein
MIKAAEDKGGNNQPRQFPSDAKKATISTKSEMNARIARVSPAGARPLCSTGPVT